MGVLEIKDVLLHSLWKQQTSLTAFSSPPPQLMYGVWAITSQSNQPSDLQIHQVAKNVS